MRLIEPAGHEIIRIEESTEFESTAAVPMQCRALKMDVVGWRFSSRVW